MKASYLIRFDDLCPTMNWGIWFKVEEILIREDIKPIVAVIPDNQDEELMIDPPRGDFWDIVRGWQNRGWTIGLHGYQHRYLTSDGGILGINKRSEFANLTYPVQRDKIEQALRIFRRENIRPEVWIAPGHSFDEITVGILRELGIRYISDGFSCHPYRDRNEVVWVPQQMARFRSMPVGVWTICLHHNSFKESDLASFRDNIQKHREVIRSFSEIVAWFGTRDQGLLDKVFGAAHRCARGVRRLYQSGCGIA